MDESELREALDDLPESEKESDRAEADRMLAIMCKKD